MPLMDEQRIQQAVEILSQGGLVAIPTETVYGLAANAWNEEACHEIFALKRRPPSNPLIVHVAQRGRLGDAVALPLPDKMEQRLAAVADLWPGPLTLVLPRNPRLPRIVTAGQESVAVRIPSHPVALKLLACCPFPLAAPSANRSTGVSPTQAEHVRDEFGGDAPLVLEGGDCRCGLESTIVTLLEDEPRLLRFGAMPAEFLAHRWGISLDVLLREAAPSEGERGSNTVVPGQLKIHYAPRTAVWLLDDAPPVDRRRGRWGRICFHDPTDREREEYAELCVISRDDDSTEIAGRLFAALRELDHLHLEGIVVDKCAEIGLGRAIMDRLRRASANRSTS
ncbi:MAG: threonylcarbamoyl-AMP synthase [Planctomycetales bacterium]|nr:threonylcarbamoyl-AMP synthase [Planctomycetales bacterium]